VYFNGTTDYITFPTVGVSAFQWSGDFTIEAFIYKFSASDRGMILSTCGNIANTGGVWFGDNNQNKLEFFSFVSNSTLAASTSTIPINQWVHIRYIKIVY
jgi:hypothetical protein